MAEKKIWVEYDGYLSELDDQIEHLFLTLGYGLWATGYDLRTGERQLCFCFNEGDSDEGRVFSDAPITVASRAHVTDGRKCWCGARVFHPDEIGPGGELLTEGRPQGG